MVIVNDGRSWPEVVGGHGQPTKLLKNSNRAATHSWEEQRTGGYGAILGWFRWLPMVVEVMGVLGVAAGGSPEKWPENAVQAARKIAKKGRLAPAADRGGAFGLIFRGFLTQLK